MSKSRLGSLVRPHLSPILDADLDALPDQFDDFLQTSHSDILPGQYWVDGLDIADSDPIELLDLEIR